MRTHGNVKWETPQKARLILQHIIPTDAKKAKMSFATEAGLLCKSGMNSFGVAVFLNAISQRGVTFQALPIHIGLRIVLEEETRANAVVKIRNLGLGTSGNMLIADGDGAVCLEFSHGDVMELNTVNGKVAHTNHFLAEHGFTPSHHLPWPDTIPRLKRATALLEACKIDCPTPTDGMRCIEKILEDEDGYPKSINRADSQGNSSATLFSIAVNTTLATGRLRLGRPSSPECVWELNPGRL